MIEIIKQTLYDNPKYIIVVFFFITFAYFISPYIGLILSIIGIATGYYFTKISSIGKAYLIYITSFLIFAKLCNLLPFSINTLLRIGTFLNIISLATTTIDNPYTWSPINNIVLTVVIILLAICTPYFLRSGNRIIIKKSVIPNSLFVILYTCIISYYYIQNPYFDDNMILHICSLVVPLLGYFVNNSWVELRALWLCMVGIFDILYN